MTRSGRTRRAVLSTLGTAVAGSLFSTGSAASSHGGWPQTGHDAANTGHAPDDTGPGVSADPGVAWTAVGASDPVVADGTVYAGTGSGMRASDADSGAEVWTAAIGGGVYGTPAVGDGTVYAASLTTRTLHAVARSDGQQQWQVELPYPTQRPLVLGDRGLYVTTQNSDVHALDLDGTERWQYSPTVEGVEAGILGTVAVADGLVIVPTAAGCVALSAADGTVQWEATSVTCTATPAVGDGTAYVPTNSGIAALATADGRVRWQFDIDGAVTASPAVADGRVYVGSDDYSLYAVESGHERWSYRTDNWVRSAPAVVDDVLYAASTDSRLYALPLDDRRTGWRVTIPDAEMDLEGSPAVADGTVFLYDGWDEVYALSADAAGEAEVSAVERPPAEPVPTVTTGPTTTATATDSTATQTAPVEPATAGTTAPAESATDGGQASVAERTTTADGGGNSDLSGAVPALGGVVGLGSAGAWVAWRRFGDDEEGGRERERGPPEEIPTTPTIDVEYGEFERGASLGTGSDATVYEAAISTGEGRVQVAIKEPLATDTLSAAEFDRFVEEAETWAKLDDHDHVVDVLDWDDDPLPWIAMEYMDGGTLGDQREGMSLPQRFWTAIGITKAVRHAHRFGITHGDIKPDNVLFRETGADDWPVPKVGDWGLSRALLDEGDVEGFTPQYAAPEQFDPDTYGGTDERTDIYQLGAVCYELFTGRPPATGSGAAIMETVTSGGIKPPSERDPSLPAALDDVLMDALAADPDDRYETAVHFRDALADAAGEEF